MAEFPPEFVGIDLSRARIAAASSRDRRDVQPLAVGWPRHASASGRVGRDVLFGKELEKHQQCLDVVRPFETDCASLTADELPRHVLATRLALEYALARVCPNRSRPAFGVIGVPAPWSIENRMVVVDAAAKVFAAAAIVPKPLAVAFGMNRRRDALVVEIGPGQVDICPIVGGQPDEDKLTNLSVGRELRSEGMASLPAPELAFLGPLARAIRGVVGRYDPEIQQLLRNNVILSGESSQMEGISRAIENRLRDYGEASVSCIADADQTGALGALELARGMPRSGWAQLRSRAGSAETEAAV